MKFIFPQDILEMSVSVSTRHITAEDQALLEDQACFQIHPKLYLETTEWYGAFVEAGAGIDILDEAAAEGYSPEFLAILDAAGKAGCTWVEFDHAGLGYQELPYLREQQPRRATGVGVLEDWE